MSLTLEIVSRHAQSLGKNRVKTFGQDGGTIGRSLESDWPLPDGHRFLSNRHASIDFRSGSYYIVDTSKNGVYINDAEQPVGRGKPQRLFPGDRIRIGEYEISVAIENVDDTRETLLNTSHIDPVDAAQRVDMPDPTRADLIDAYAITGVGIEMYLEDDDEESLKPLYDKYRTGNTSSRIEGPQDDMPSASNIASIKPSIKPQAQATRAKQVQSKSNSALAAFFRGAGIEEPELTDKQTEELLARLGQVVRELIVGSIDCLHLRALQKAQLKQATTIIQPRENNRLKFSANFEEGFSRLFLDESDQYTNAVESVRSAFADIKQHQRSLLKATRGAVNEYLERLDPQNLEQRAANGKTGALINAANKLKYWDLYKEVYAILGSGTADDLPQPFLDAFAKHYERHSASPVSNAKKRDKREAS